MTKMRIFGAGGRMGRAISEAARDRSEIEIVDSGPDVFIDFSAPAALDTHVGAAVAAQRPIVIGTTGITAEHHRIIDDAAARIPVLQAANMSLGVNLLAHLVRETAARLGTDWDIEILEMHHRHKVDAPSETALLLGEAAAEGRGAPLDTLAVRRREAIADPRKEGSIGFASLRGGSVAGDHQILFAAEGERIELGHRAESRAIFARGAIQAALWLLEKPPGRYTMADVLGLK